MNINKIKKIKGRLSMKTEIKNRIKTAIEAYKKENNEFKEQIDAWKKDTIYSNEYKQIQIEELQGKIKKNTSEYKEDIKNILAEEKKTVFGEPATKPADYQIQISNALKFIELAGDTLSDKRVSGILEPFKNDYETMKLFQDVVTNQMKGTGVWNDVKNTFEKTSHITELKDSFDTVESTYDGLFDDSLNGAIRSNYFLRHIDDIENLAEKI
jgi:hypothetical protein